MHHATRVEYHWVTQYSYKTSHISQASAVLSTLNTLCIKDGGQSLLHVISLTSTHKSENKVRKVDPVHLAIFITTILVEMVEWTQFELQIQRSTFNLAPINTESWFISLVRDRTRSETGKGKEEREREVRQPRRELQGVNKPQPLRWKHSGRTWPGGMLKVSCMGQQVGLDELAESNSRESAGKWYSETLAGLAQHQNYSQVQSSGVPARFSDWYLLSD